MQVKTCNSILEAIGNTPLIRLNEITKSLPAKVYAKVEGLNPGLSAKDRIALYMIEKAEHEGRLQPGGTIIEATSGNTGFGIAMVSAVKGYNCILCTKKKTSQERYKPWKLWVQKWSSVHLLPQKTLALTIKRQSGYIKKHPTLSI